MNDKLKELDDSLNRIKDLEHNLFYILDGLKPNHTGFVDAESVTKRAYEKALRALDDVI